MASLSFYHEEPVAHEGTNRPAVILFHGLTGTPEEMRPLAEVLHSHGFDVYVPLLAGHELDIEALRTVPAQAWLADAQQAFLTVMARKPSAVYSAGLSFGSYLALYVATRSSAEIKGVVVLAPPIQIRSAVQDAGLNIVSYLPDFILNRLGIVEKKDRPATLFQHPRRAYAAHSIAALARSRWIFRNMEADLGRIACPVLLLQDPDEHHLPADCIRILQRKLTAADITQRWFPGAEHEMTMGPRAREVNEHIAEFLRKIA